MGSRMLALTMRTCTLNTHNVQEDPKASERVERIRKEQNWLRPIVSEVTAPVKVFGNSTELDCHIPAVRTFELQSSGGFALPFWW